MQTVAHKSALRGTVARPSRSAVVVRASAESRRAVLTGFLAGAAATIAAPAFAAVTSVDIIDDRKVLEKGFDIIYEARDLALPQATRDGMSQPRGSLSETLARVKVSEARLDTEIEPSIKKAYWTEAREQLRRQVGTLRFDLNVLADAKPKPTKAAVQALKKTFITKVEDLDFALRSKDQASAQAKLEVAKKALDDVLAALA